MSIATELTLLANSKQSIKNSINAKGGSITDSTPFADYSTAIDNLPSGGGDNSTLINLIERDITSINIPSGTTSIGQDAFHNCSSLTSVTIPSSVTDIGASAFWSCTSLTSVTIPDSVTSIGGTAFNSCYALASVTIGNGVTTIGSNAFGSCRSLTSVTIPDSVTSIGSNAFQNCSSLASVTIGNGVTTIGASAFTKCTGLTSVTVNATTPPTLSNVNAFSNTNDCPIYVPAESVDAYKAANNWSTLASRIQAIPTE